MKEYCCRNCLLIMMIELESGKLFANSTDTKGGLFTLQIIRQSQCF